MGIRKLFAKLCILTFPFALLALFIVWTDPFCLLHTNFIPLEVKAKSAFPLNTCLAQMIQFEQHPKPNILLGDSRMGLLSTADIQQISGADYSNMSYGGASLNEVVDTFWTANKAVPLRNVYIGIGFNQYNDYNYSNRTEPAMVMINFPPLYFTNRIVLKAAWFTARMQYLGVDPDLTQPKATREQVWAGELAAHSNWSARYLKPVRYHARLEEISKYCHEKKINLRFIIFPGHTDLQAIPHRYHRDAEYAQFKQDLAELGPVFDYDLPNEEAANPANYSDPVHFRQSIAKKIITQVFGSERQVKSASPVVQLRNTRR